MREWSLREATKNLSAVVEAALAGEPQSVSRRGKPAVVVLGWTSTSGFVVWRRKRHRLSGGCWGDRPRFR